MATPFGMEPDENNLALSQGLLGLGAGLLSGSFGHYGAFAPALGQGVAGFQSGYNTSINSQVQNKLYKAHIAKFQADVDKENRMGQASSQIGGILSGAPQQPPPGLLAMPTAQPTTPALSSTPQMVPSSVPGLQQPQEPLIKPLNTQDITGVALPPPQGMAAGQGPRKPPTSDQLLQAYQIASANGLPGAEKYYADSQKAQKDESYQKVYGDTLDQAIKNSASTTGAGGPNEVIGSDPTKTSKFWRQLSDNLRNSPGMMDSAKEAETRAIEFQKQEQGQGNQDRQNQHQTMQSENSLRDDYNKQSKTFVDVRDGYQRVLASAQNPSAAGDLSLIFAYMKVLDPGSTVREGEQAAAANAQGVPDKIRNLYNRIMTGERLAPEQRQDFVSRAGDLYGSALGNQQELEGRYTDISRRSMVNPENVVFPYRVKKPAELKDKYGF